MNDDVREVLEIALAGCFHDIGKLLQRAGMDLSDGARRMEQMLCPTRAGQATHKHVLWTNDFLEHGLAWLPAGLDRRRINGPASAHHRPGSPEEWIIAEADRIASGHDRREAEGQQQNFRTVPLHSILAGLKLDAGLADPHHWYPPHQVFAGSAAPQSDRPVPDLTPHYRAVADALHAHVRAWNNPLPAPLAAASAWALSRRFCSMTTASTIDRPDVSLHDHASLVAAFAGAMYRYHQITGTLQESAIRDRSAVKYRFVTGDVGGIQNFIFAPPPEGSRKGMARMFRARSFYVSMLTRVATIELLEAAGLPCFNRVIDAGGRFILLVDGTKQTLDALRQAERRLQEWLVARHYGVLKLNIDYQRTARGSDFDEEHFGLFYRGIQSGAEAARTRQLASWLQPQGRWDEQAQCLSQANYRRAQERATKIDLELGKYLPQARYVALFRGQAGCSGLIGDGHLPELSGHSLQLLSSPDQAEQALQAGNLAELFVIGGAGGPSELSWIPSLPLANYVPLQSEADVRRLQEVLPAGADEEEDDQDRIAAGNPATFRHLAHLSTGAAMIAVLKADVDRLGMLFSRGFGDKVGFGRISTLSRMMDAFSKEFLPARFVENGSRYRHVYTIFAGGDDLMLVGPWDVMMDLAADLHRWFRAFACGNPDVTLSAGLVLGKPKTPITSLGRLAEEQLEAAKDAGRDRIAVFNQVYTWNEYATALEAGEKLSRLAAGPEGRPAAVGRGFLYQLVQIGKKIHEMAQAQKNRRPLPLAAVAWRSHLAYDFRRNVLDRIRPGDVTSDLQEGLQWIESLLGLSVPRDRSGERILQLAATCALYLNRGGAR